MPIFAKLTRKLQTALTTDARPDPPRIILEGPDPNSNLSTAEIKQKSAPVTPDPQRVEGVIPVIKRQSSATNSPAQNSEFLNAEELGFSEPTKPQPRPRSPRTKANKPKSKTASSGNVINYMVVDSHHVNIGPQKNFIYNLNQFSGNCYTNSENGIGKPKDKPMPDDVEQLSRCEEVISRDDMLLVKANLGSNWRDVARRLGYSDGRIDQFKEDHTYVEEAVYQMLRDWKQANTKDAQVGKLILAIWSSQEYNCAEELAASHKTST